MRRLRLRPDDATALFNFDKLLTDLGKVEVLLAEYREMLRHRPDWDAVQNNLAWKLVLTRDRPARDYDEALDARGQMRGVHSAGRQSHQHAGAGRVSCSPLGRIHPRGHAVNHPPEGRVNVRLVFPGHGPRAERGEKTRRGSGSIRRSPGQRSKTLRNSEFRQFWTEAAKLVCQPQPQESLPHVLLRCLSVRSRVIVVIRPLLTVLRPNDSLVQLFGADVAGLAAAASVISRNCFHEITSIPSRLISAAIAGSVKIRRSPSRFAALFVTARSSSSSNSAVDDQLADARRQSAQCLHVVLDALLVCLAAVELGQVVEHGEFAGRRAPRAAPCLLTKSRILPRPTGPRSCEGTAWAGRTSGRA